ncbi:M6 family metalloprotease domain-containing protein [Candidatus Thalassolituus haligoni]|uniref:M6 family metalloprotease domain-containing protein n=1 Tax=Candidatus Thalassolituus haligoni TaxID=3100113 RepID=UPI003512E282
MSASLLGKLCLSCLLLITLSLANASLPAPDGLLMPPLEDATAVRASIGLTDVAKPNVRGLVLVDRQVNAIAVNRTQRLLVIRVAFSNQGFVYSNQQVEQRFFAAGQSVSAYYAENSYGALLLVAANPDNPVVDVTLDYPHPDFGMGAGGGVSALLAQNIMQALEQQGGLPDLTALDLDGNGHLSAQELGIVFVIAGYEHSYAGASASHPRVWAHKTAFGQLPIQGVTLDGYAMVGEQHEDHLATLGVICHELGHLLLGLPDLHNNTGFADGVGRWGLMGLGGWNGEQVAGDSPAHLLAWSKHRAGFLQPEAVGQGISLWQLESSSLMARALEIPVDDYRHGERVLLEYRTHDGFDQALPHNMLLVSRVDDRLQSMANVATAVQATPLETGFVLSEAVVSDTDRWQDQGIYTLDGSHLLALISGQGGEQGAQLRVERLLDMGGRNLGYAEWLATDGWFVNRDDRALVIHFDMETQPEDSTIEGVDIYAVGAGMVHLSLTAMPAARSGCEIVDQDMMLEAGWNRIPFSAHRLGDCGAVLALSVSAVAGAIISAGASIGLDRQGSSSGQTFLQQQVLMTVQPYDVNVRLLYRLALVPWDDDTGTQASTVPETTSKTETPLTTVSSTHDTAGTSGGSGWWLLILGLPLLWASRSSNRTSA